MNRFLKRHAAALSAALLLVTTANVASARWDPARAAREARDRARRSVEAEAGRAADAVQRAHQLNFAVQITNPTGGYLSYSFNGERQIPLRPYSTITLRGTHVGNPTISFGNGQHQVVHHSLSRQGGYIFRWVNGTLVLYAQ